MFAGLLKRHHRPTRFLVRARRAIRRALDHNRRRAGAETAPAWQAFVNAELVARTGLPDRFEADNRANASAGEREEHLRAVSSNLQSLAFEVLDRAAASAEVEPRYPFWDKRLVEFCLALPANEKLAGGWSRLILRRAMEGILAPAVQWRADKLDFTPHLTRGMVLHHRALIESVVVADEYGVGKYANLENVATAYRRILDKAESADGHDVHTVWRTVVLGLWLRHQGSGSPRTRPSN